MCYDKVIKISSFGVTNYIGARIQIVKSVEAKLFCGAQDRP